MSVYVKFDGDFKEHIICSGWDLEDIGQNIFKISSPIETHIVEVYQDDQRFKILTDVVMDFFLNLG